jgi:cation transport ATPase
MPDTPDRSELSIAAIVREVAASITGVIRAEARLARLDIRESAPKAIRAAAVIAAGVIIALYGLGFLFTAAYLGISRFLWPWLSALIVGEVLFVGGGTVAWAAALYLKHLRQGMHHPR